MSETEQPLRITPDMLLSRRVDFERRMRRLPKVTVWLIGTLAFTYVVELMADAAHSAHAIVVAGALTRAGVFGGEYWRLLSATFLHGGVNHLVGNAIALYIIGMVCEHAYGRRQFTILYVASALSGSVMSVLLSPGPSVGASGAIFGLQAASIVLFRRYRDRLLVRDRRIGVVMAVWAVYAVFSGLVSDYVDNGAHIGGALGGALVARTLHPIVLDPLDETYARAVRRWFWVAVAAVVVSLLGWVVSVGSPASALMPASG